jgi:hypothetical protein
VSSAGFCLSTWTPWLRSYHCRIDTAGLSQLTWPVVFAPMPLVPAAVSLLLLLLDPPGPQDVCPVAGDKRYPHPSLLCGLIRPPPMSLLGSRNNLDAQLPCSANTDVRDLAAVLSIHPCCSPVPRLLAGPEYFVIVQDAVLVHPACHVSVNGACSHITSFPPPSGPGHMLAS